MRITATLLAATAPERWPTTHSNSLRSRADSGQPFPGRLQQVLELEGIKKRAAKSVRSHHSRSIWSNSCIGQPKVVAKRLPFVSVAGRVAVDGPVRNGDQVPVVGGELKKPHASVLGIERGPVVARFDLPTFDDPIRLTTGHPYGVV